jgi:predicted RNA-binding protein with RPS1 domain
MTELVEGETRHGKVTSITNFGAFVDLGGADGLIHVSELSWSRVENPRQVLKVGDEIDVYVLDVDRERKRIALSLKKLQPDPWTIVDDHYEAGQLIEGRVTRVLDFGAFVELDLGVEGLLHASEMIGTPDLNPSDIVHPGEKLLVKVIRVDSRRKRLALSARQVRKDEWERWVAEQQAAREAEEEKAAREAEEEKAKAELEASEVIEGEVVEEAEAELETSEVIEREVVEEAEAELETSEVIEGEVAGETAPTPVPEAETEAVAAMADMETSEAPTLEVADASTTEEEIAVAEAERGETEQVGKDTPEAAFDSAATDEAEKIKEAEERAAETAEPDVAPVPEAAAEEATSVDPQVL